MKYIAKLPFGSSDLYINRVLWAKTHICADPDLKIWNCLFAVIDGIISYKYVKWEFAREEDYCLFVMTWGDK